MVAVINVSMGQGDAAAAEVLLKAGKSITSDTKKITSKQFVNLVILTFAFILTTH